LGEVLEYELILKIKYEFNSRNIAPALHNPVPKVDFLSAFRHVLVHFSYDSRMFLVPVALQLASNWLPIGFIPRSVYFSGYE